MNPRALFVAVVIGLVWLIGLLEVCHLVAGFGFGAVLCSIGLYAIVTVVLSAVIVGAATR